ncbi:hypothetical protein TOPH_05103 [Tolypocladium ophioglossoides CBS 100239]|uniref:Uncharacterized protein n=1 Tax=Tolypocladium ophioglossoides (strain CBS 100239) TaxID=1163406 RepID=A0A0L0N860_TOLOC|nr:hypothetical protein TOPH_05103 [Tolypocladium ophioglossoides CBS 100239]
MAAPTETIPKLQANLEQYIKPREQVNYIRRILALQLGSYTGERPAVPPLSLTYSTRDVSASPEVKGVQKEYLEALHANIAARRQFDEALQAGRPKDDLQSKPPSLGPELLEERLALLKLRQKREGLLVIQQSLDRLSEKPASTQSFLDTEEIFHDATALPIVPKTIINSFVAEQSAAQPDLQVRVNQLEKAVLRAKLLLKQEERLLAEARARSKSKPDVVSNGAKLEALNTTRNELINWIETELGKASAGDESAEGTRHTRGPGTEADQATIATQLRQIQDKYARYLAARKALLALATHNPQPSIPPPTQQTGSAKHGDDDDSEPGNYLLTPYVEALLSISRHQKAAIIHKSHMSSVLSKQNKDTCQVLGHLAEESHLLPSYPLKDSLRRPSGIRNEMPTESSDRPDISTRIKPWVVAADSAKIATLEVVAETIEGGQIALENSMKSLQDIDHLLGQGEGEVADIEPVDEDVWLSSEGNRAAAARKHSEKKAGPSRQKGDPWSRLHGNLGLISHGDED